MDERTRDLMGLHVILTGNLGEGFTVTGPFKTGEDAIRYGERLSDREGDDSWCIAKLAAPVLDLARILAADWAAHDLSSGVIFADGANAQGDE